jgi:SAM-dependent methyltransferase
MNTDLAKQLSEQVRAFYEEHGAWFATTRNKLMPEQGFVSAYIRPGMTIADVGAGNGRLAKILPEGVTYIGVEPSETLRTGSGFTERMLAGQLPHLPLPDHTADVTACLAVLHHIATREGRRASVEELVRITKPDGIILATSWLQNPHGDETATIEGGEPGDRWMPWDGPDGQALRYVHFMQPGEWAELWMHPALEIIQIGMHGKRDWTNDPGEALNWRVIARRR